MFKKFDKKFFFPVLAAGLFYGLSFPPVNLYFLIFFSFVIILDITLKSSSYKQVIVRTYFVFFIASLVSVSWISISGMQENADRFLIFGGLFVLIVYPLFFIPPVLIYYFTNRNLAAKYPRYISLIAFPFLWTGFEYLQTFGQINFPWIFAGNSQTYNLSKIQYADITGLFGVSFWICTLSILIFYLFKRLSGNDRRVLSVKNILFISLIVLIYFLPDIYDSNSNKNYPSEGQIRVGIVQPNINPWNKWGGKKQSDLIYGYTEQIKKIHSENPDVSMIILPETALPYYFREAYFESRYNVIKNICDSLNLPLLIGTPDSRIYEDPSAAPVDAKIMKSTGIKYDAYNSAVLFEPLVDKNDLQKHDKIKLVIGSERMPYQEIFPFTKNLIEWGVGIGNWQIGKDTNIFVLPGGAKFNTAICYESVYPEFFASFVNKGADFSVIITNDGWWGKLFGTYQHNRFAVFRAVENRRWIARCANTGISDFIDPYGNMYEETEINEKADIVLDIGLIKEKTFYTIHGDLFSRVCLFFGILIFGSSFFFRKPK